MNIWVGSRNPVKIEATHEAFRRHFPDVRVAGFAVPSGVSPQPVGMETLRGAIRRVQALRNLPEADQADFFVGIEGGIARIWGCWFAFGVAVIENRAGRRGVGISPLFPVPGAWISRMLQGEEMGTLVDEASGRTNTKHDMGAIGFLTRGDMDRRELYVHGLRVALIPFLQPEEDFGCEDAQEGPSSDSRTYSSRGS